MTPRLTPSQLAILSKTGSSDMQAACEELMEARARIAELSVKASEAESLAADYRDRLCKVDAEWRPYEQCAVKGDGR